MTTRRPVHLDVDLPELSPSQASFLWDVLTDLTAALWDAYEADLVETEQHRLHLLDPEDHCRDLDDDPGFAPDAPGLNRLSSPPVTDTHLEQPTDKRRGR